MTAPIARSIWKPAPEAVQSKAQRQHERAKRDALKHIAQDIPDASHYARYLPAKAIEALGRVSRSRAAGWNCRAPDAPLLRSYSLVGYGTTGLTAFGVQVLQAIDRKGA